MRIGLWGAALSLCFVGLCSAQTSHASIRKDLSVPAEGLSPALQTVGTTYGLQVLYPTAIVKDLKTQGASGSLTPEEALRQVLSGTGLSYKYLDSRTVTVFATTATAAAGAPDQTNTAQDNSKEAGKKTSQDFRLAQVDQAPAGAKVEKEQTSKQGEPALSEVVVTAQKRQERLQDVPMSISVLGGSDLDQSTFISVTDALATVPGVSTIKNYQGGGTMVTIRGVAAGNPLSEGPSPIAYYVDGVPFGLVKDAIAPDEDVYDLARIEVLRGPQGTLYGASAENGVVRVLTNDPDLHQFDFSVRGSDFGTQYGGNSYGADTMFNVPIVDGVLAARAVLGYAYDAGWIDQPNKSDVNDAELRNYRLKVSAAPADNLTIGLSAWSSHSDFGAPSFGYTYNKSSAILDQPLSTDFDAYGLKIGYLSPWFSISSETSYLDYTNKGTLDLNVFGIPGVTWFDEHNSYVFSQELYLNSRSQGAWRWSLGGMWRHASENGTSVFNGLAPPSTDQLGSKSYAIFGELTRLFFDGKLELTFGMRHFHDDVTQEIENAPGTPVLAAESTSEANTPRAILVWHPNENQMIYASYSEGFRSGYPQGAGVPTTFPAVEPDKLKNYEIGSKGSLLGGRVQYDSALYYIDWVHVQQTLTVPYVVGGQSVPTAAIVNGQGASGIGVDFALSTQPASGLTVGINAGWNDLTIDSAIQSGNIIFLNKGDRLNFSPETTAGAFANYAFPLGSNGLEGKVSASGQYTSAQIFRLQLTPDLVNVGTGDPLVNSRVAFSVSSAANWMATVFVDNVNNERGTPERNPVGIVDWSARVRPRTFGAQLSYHFR